MIRGRKALRLAGAATVATGLAVLGVVLWPRAPVPPEPPATANPPVAAEPQGTAPPETELRTGAPIERSMGPEEVHAYRVELQEGDFLDLVVDQNGADVVVTLRDPEGATVARVDEPIGDLGPERLQALAATPGTHRLEVRSWPGGAEPGAYRVDLRALRQATEEDRLRAEAAAIYRAADELRRSKRRRDSVSLYRDAAERWRALGDDSAVAEARHRLCTALSFLEEWEEAVAECSAAADLFRRVGEARPRAMALRDLGLARFRRGEIQPAVSVYTRALQAAEEAGDPRLVVEILDVRAPAYQVLDEAQAALDDYHRVLAAGRDRSDPRGWGFTQHNLGVLYRLRGELELARDHLEQAAEFRRRPGNERQLAASLNQLGQLARDRGDIGEALSLFAQALELRRAAGDRRGQARTLEKLGRLKLDLGQTEEARGSLGEALRVLEGIEDPRGRASLLLALGELERRARRFPRALAFYRQALALYRGVGDLSEQADGLLGIARVERGRGHLETALQSAEEALGLVESVRLRSLRQDLRTSFLATANDHFELTIEVLMDLHRLHPERDYAARALTVSERARARSFVDGLTEAGAEIRRGADRDLLRRERELQVRLNAAERRRFGLIELAEAGELSVELGEVAPEATAGVEREVRALLAELEGVRAELRATSPQYASLTQPGPAELSEIQGALLDRETLLLEYRLGEERSFLWLVSPGSLEVAELPRRAVIEELARRGHELLQESHRREIRAGLNRTLCHLSRLLLSPVAGQLGSRHLVVVPDGALAYLPFAALPSPSAVSHPAGCTSPRPLLQDHTVSYLPSASALVALRGRAAGRPRAERLLAVVADPVFDPGDARVGSRRAEAGRASLPRLVFARREAEALLALVPPDRRFGAFDFEATKSVVTEGPLRDYRLVHLATHGILDTERPELSALVFALLDERGRPQDGYLHAHEIYNLDLPAELVVLSACETALGKEVRGEGLVGLTHGFFYAGAERVVVSLWRVSDRSTAELMERFYRGLLLEGSAPASALRTAQLSMQREAAHAAPYYWAGFVLQGEWESD